MTTSSPMEAELPTVSMDMETMLKSHKVLVQMANDLQDAQATNRQLFNELRALQAEIQSMKTDEPTSAPDVENDLSTDGQY